MCSSHPSIAGSFIQNWLCVISAVSPSPSDYSVFDDLVHASGDPLSPQVPLHQKRRRTGVRPPQPRLVGTPGKSLNRKAGISLVTDSDATLSCGVLGLLGRPRPMAAAAGLLLRPIKPLAPPDCPPTRQKSPVQDMVPSKRPSAEPLERPTHTRLSAVPSWASLAAWRQHPCPGSYSGAASLPSSLCRPPPLSQTPRLRISCSPLPSPTSLWRFIRLHHDCLVLSLAGGLVLLLFLSPSTGVFLFFSFSSGILMISQ